MDQNNNKKETFSAIVMANALQVSQNGKESVAIQVQAIKNLVTDEEVEKRFIGNLWITPAAVDGTIKTLKDVFDYKEHSFLPLNNPQYLNGKEVEITVEYEVYNGTERASIRWFNKPGSFESRRIKPIAQKLAEDIAQRLDGYFYEEDARPAENTSLGSANPYARQTRQNIGAADDDDIPF